MSKSVFIGMLIIIGILIFLAKIQSGFFYLILTWLFGCIYMIIYNFTIADIYIEGDVLLLKKMLSQKKLNISGLKVYDISIGMGPFFFITTSAGFYNINYTKLNYQQILELLKRTQYNKIELFESKVRKCIININDR
jgi:hypothetical protein